MKKVLFAGLLLVAATAFAQVEFYGGDGDGRNGLASESNGLVADAWVFDDFNHAGGAIANIWGNYLTNYPSATQAKWELRSGISNGNGGTLIGSGTRSTTFVATGRNYFGFPEYQIKGNISLSAPAGTYYLSIAPIGTGSVRAFVSTTSGKDLGPTTDPNPPPTGGPIANGNSWFRSTTFGVNYGPTSDQLGAGTWDFSYGVGVPEPATLLALAALTLIRRR